MGPFDHAENYRDAEIDEQRTPTHRQDRRQRHPQRQVRKRLDDLNTALGQDVGPAAVISGDAADQDAEREADRHAEKANGQRNTRTVNHARQQVTAEPISAGQVQLPAPDRADEVEIAREQSPEAVFATMAEEADRLPLVRV